MCNHFGSTDPRLLRTDTLSVRALETMVRTYGQMPEKLFKTPHLGHTARHRLLNRKEPVQVRKLIFLEKFHCN